MDSNCKLFRMKILSNVWDFYEMIALQDMKHTGNVYKASFRIFIFTTDIFY